MLAAAGFVLGIAIALAIAIGMQTSRRGGQYL
jgi:ABC-type nitrate/sulfonate/bicarbonate transport system permease component